MKLLGNQISSKSLCFLLGQFPVIDKNVNFEFHSYEEDGGYDLAVGEVRITNGNFIEFRKKEPGIRYRYPEHDEWPSNEERRFLLCVVRITGQNFSLHNSTQPQLSPLALFPFADVVFCSADPDEFFTVLYELLPGQEVEVNAEFCTDTRETSLYFKLKDYSFIFN